jgi:hypothetical protein
MKTIYGIAGKMYQIVRPTRDRHYLKFIRQFPCVGCGNKSRRTDAMHTGSHGMGQKASDADALPGCRSCHQQLHEVGSMKFQSRHKIDFAELQIMFRGFYCLEFPGRCCWDDCSGVLATEAGMAVEGVKR